jgi:DNA-binding response OmpR family regulator
MDVKSTILLIDDEAIVRELLTAILTTKGYRAVCAANSHEARCAIRSQVTDLILLDVCLGDEDGLSVLRDFRKQAATARTPVILLTGVSDKSVIVRAAKLHVHGYILKSTFSSQELLSRVKCALQGKENQDTAEPTKSGSVARIEGNPTSRGIIKQVIRMAGSPTTQLADLSAVIARDPIFCAKVLEVANSPTFSTGDKSIVEIQDAIRQIGCSAIRDLAAAMGNI